MSYLCQLQVVIGLLASLSLSGCGESQSEQSTDKPHRRRAVEPGAESPQELVMRLEKVYRTRDLDLFVASVCPPSMSREEKEIYRAGLDLTLVSIEVRKFLKAAEAKFGFDELAAAFAKIDKDGIRGFRFLAAYPDWQRFIDEGVVESDGQYANVELPKSEEEKKNPIEFVATRVRAKNIEGRWYFMWGVPVMSASGSLRRKQVMLTFLEAANVALASSDTPNALADKIAQPLETMKEDRKPTEKERVAMVERTKVLKERSEANRKQRESKKTPSE